MEQVDEVLYTSRAARGDDGDVHRVADRAEHLHVKALPDAVGVDGVHHHLPRAVADTALDPLDGLHARVLAAALGEHAELAVHPLDIGRQHHALVTVALSGLIDQIGVADGSRVDRHLVGTALQHAVEVLQGVDAAPHGQGDEDGGGHLAEDIGKEGAALHRGGDVVEHQLVGAAVGVEFAQLHRGGHVAHSLKVDALDHAAVSDVQTGDDSLCDHLLASLMASARSMAPV